MSAERGVIPPVTITLAGKQVDGLIFAVGHASTDQGVVKITVREPDSYMGWIEVDGDGHHFAVWRPTGAVYTVGADGVVGDDPVWGTTESGVPARLAGRPLLKVIFDELQSRGWKLAPDGIYEDPEGNRWPSLEAAIAAQSFREIAQAGAPDD